MEREVKAIDLIHRLFREVFGFWEDWPDEVKIAWDHINTALDFALLARKIGATKRVAHAVYADDEGVFKELTEDEKRKFVKLWRAWAKEFTLDPDELFRLLPEARDYL